MLRYDGQVKYDGLLGLSSHVEMVSCLLRKYEIAYPVRRKWSNEAILRLSINLDGGCVIVKLMRSTLFSVVATST